MTRVRMLAATLLLVSGSLFAQTDSTEPETCPHIADGACPCAHHGEAGGDGGPMGMFGRMGDELALTEAQKQEYAALMQIYGPRMKELVTRGEDNRRVFMSMAPDNPAYNAEADKLAADAGASAAEMTTLLAELQSNAYALLSAEQQARYMTLREEQMQRMEERKAEMQARRAAGELDYGTGHQCKACMWLEEDDKALEAAEGTAE